MEASVLYSLLHGPALLDRQQCFGKFAVTQKQRKAAGTLLLGGNVPGFTPDRTVSAGRADGHF
jgi:hypothetical protein